MGLKSALKQPFQRILVEVFAAFRVVDVIEFSLDATKDGIEVLSFIMGVLGESLNGGPKIVTRKIGVGFCHHPPGKTVGLPRQFFRPGPIGLLFPWHARDYSGEQ